MSAPNFWTMDNFDLYVVGTEDVLRMFLDYEDGDEYTDADIYFAWDCFNHCLSDDEYSIQSIIDELNKDLQWYNVQLKYGYYEGVQIYIDTDYLSIGYWDDEDCLNEFGKNKKETIYMILEEQKKIQKWLEEDATQCGFRKLICDGVFSNGEAIYHYA